jgi:uncharacterized protein YdeI (YjbR/CyaY-like superfamily)
MVASSIPDVYVKDRAQWHLWLEEHAADSKGIWLVYDKGANRTISYDDIVEEALCYGWVDSLTRRHNDSQAKLYLAPRKPKSNWSKRNKELIEKLQKQNALQPAGIAAIERAMADGSWNALDEVEKLIEPDDLKLALQDNEAAWTNWNGFPRSAKRAILEWILNAKQPATRAQRIHQTVAEAALNRRANQWRQPKSLDS